MDTGARAREEVVLAELAFWWQLTVGLWLSSWGVARQTPELRQATSFPGGFSSHLLLLVARLSSLHDLGDVC